MARDRRTFTLEPEAVEILNRVGNYSDYANRIVLQHAKEWTEALALLRECGWRSEEILAACDALCGYSLRNAAKGGEFLSEELQRREKAAGHFAQREVSAPRRERCFAQLAEAPLVAHALVVLVREFWLYNEDCQQAIRLSAVRAKRPE